MDTFTSAPILLHSDPTKAFVVQVDASTSDVGAILSQRQGHPPKFYPCAFLFKKLLAELRYQQLGAIGIKLNLGPVAPAVRKLQLSLVLT